ncbi:hypothetical protein [Microbulbifer thermotolerans]|uniref:hypothetical protein n=1 Tax=Microbulbifer thermotolerans TaxID=252514 RepID=UPI00224B30A9|nr:hypothetical protein [Microbulbifer thermotolerans]MCX2781255.1 hypothetical protein [Microbulbifer thermotolerans]MCX2806666.1 hypothetical protein [Microbulbifer thermotolerans]WKT61909.1 hypothetical protein Q2E61_06850 [Microbulbifer thermotolerans]
MQWDNDIRTKYHNFAKTYISTYNKKIDCADLAIAALVEFAADNKLPIRFKYYDRGWKWSTFDPENDEKIKFKRKAMLMFGALNVIDNTKEIAISDAKSGDFIMSRWSTTLGHTRVIYSVTPEGDKFKVVWYQGSLPPIKPEKKEEYFSRIAGVYKNKPRRWNFDQFEG